MAFSFSPTRAEASKARGFFSRACRTLLSWPAAPTIAQVEQQFAQRKISLSEAVANIRNITGADPETVMRLLVNFAQTDLESQVRTQVEAQAAITGKGADVLALDVGDGALFQYRDKWFYQATEGVAIYKTLALDSVMGIPNASDLFVEKVLSDTVNFYAQKEYQAGEEKAYFFNVDINGLKLINEAARIPDPGGTSTSPYRHGLHHTGDAALSAVGDVIKDARFKGFFFRNGGDELSGVALFKSPEEATAFAENLNQLYAQKINEYLDEQKAYYENVLRQDRQAQDWSQLSKAMRTQHLATFEKTKAEIIRKTEEHLFRLDKDRPSLSFGLALIDSGLAHEALADGFPALELVKKETDSLMIANKHAYKEANGLPISRDGTLDLSKRENAWVAPHPGAPLRFRRAN